MTSDDSEPGIVVPTQRARQGVTGHNVRYVLGLAAIIVVFAAIYLTFDKSFAAAIPSNVSPLASCNGS